MEGEVKEREEKSRYFEEYAGALAQLGARNTGSVEVTGSNPVCSKNTLSIKLNPGVRKRHSGILLSFGMVMPQVKCIRVFYCAKKVF